MSGQFIEFDERPRIHECVDALACGLLALGMLLVHAALAAGMQGGIDALPQILDPLRCRVRCPGLALLGVGHAHSLRGYLAVGKSPRTVATVPSPWNDLRRPPLRGEHLARLLTSDGWQVTVVEETQSTQEAVRAAIAAGAPAGTVVIAEFQSAGRGRRDRQWESPPRAGITMSVLVRPDQISPWTAIAMALAAAAAINREAAEEAGTPPVRLKWPNDLILHGRKIGGVIAEVEGDAVIVGLGLNVSTTRDELPVEHATSLALEGLEIDRETLVKAILRTLTEILRNPSEWARDYLELLDTIGRRVRVVTIDGEFVGTAEGVDDHGHLIVDGRSFSVGDVIHLR